MPKNIAPRGNPIAMPTIDQPNHSAYQNRGPNHTRSNFIQGPQVGRNTLDAPSSSNTSNTKGHAFGGKSLVLNKHRSEGNGRSVKAPRIANPSFGLSSFSAGVPSAGSKIKPLVMLPESTSPSVTTESADLPHHKQYRDASNAARIVHHSLPPTREKSRKMQTRSEAKKPQANDETIVLDDSDDDDRQSNDLPSSSQSPQTHFHQVNGNGKSEEKDDPASGSPVESLTTTGDTEMEENRSAFQAEESIESNPKAISSPNGHTGHHFLHNLEEERKESHKNTSSLPSALPTLQEKSFVIAQPLDASRSRITDKMKGKDGQTKSMIDTRSTAKAKNHNDKYYSSRLNTRSNFSGISDKPIKLKLRKIAFDPDGFIGFEASPTVELTSSGESIEICWDEDGSGGKGQNTVINFNDCESLRASKDSSSMYPKPHRYLEITMVEDCDTFNKVKELLEKILGFGAVRGSNRIILDAIQQDSREEHKWVELRKRLSKMRIRPLQGLENNSAESIEELLKKLKPLTSTRVDQSSSISSINNFQTTPVPRPKARPSASNTSKYFVSSSSSNPLRTSDVRGTKHNDKDGKAQRDIAQRREPPPVQSKSPSPKKALDPNKKLLSYPFHNLSPGYVTILQSDLDRLDPGEFLNDTMIDFGLKYLLEEIRQRDPDLCKEIFVFSSFFYNRLNEKKSDRKVGYELVKKWTRKAELFKKKYIVVPINENLHWYLAILINPLFAIPQEIRDGKERDKEAIAGSEYNSARSSPRSGVEPSTEEDTTRDNDLFAGNISAQHQQVPEIDGDGDSNMFPVLDRRTDAETYQIYAHSDAISNNGGGTVEGGGGNQKRGNPIEPGQSFPENEDSKRSRTTISSRRHETQSPGKIATSSFYGPNGIVNSPSPESNPRRSPDLRRSARISGPSSPVNNFDFTLSRRSSMNLSQDLSQTWRKQLNEEATVCVFDSLQQKHSPVKTAMKHYLAYEYADKHNLKDAIDMKRIDLNLIDVTMPRQPNWADCGLYLLHAFERFFSDPETFKNDVIPAKNERHSEWKSEEALDLRVSWKATIERLSGEWFAEQERRDQERLQKKAKGNGSSTTEDDLSDGKQEDGDDIEIGGTDSVEVVQSPGASSDATNVI